MKYVNIPLDDKYLQEKKVNYVILCWLGMRGWMKDNRVEVPESMTHIQVISEQTTAGSRTKVRTDLAKIRDMGYLVDRTIPKEAYEKFVQITNEEAFFICRNMSPKEAKLYLFLRGWYEYTFKTGYPKYVFTNQRLCKALGYTTSSWSAQNMGDTVDALCEMGAVRRHIHEGRQYLDEVRKLDEIYTGRQGRTEKERVEDLRIPSLEREADEDAYEYDDGGPALYDEPDRPSEIYRAFEDLYKRRHGGDGEEWDY